MRAVVQRVEEASVSVKQQRPGSEEEINRGLVILLGVGQDDSAAEGKWLAEKILNLRIFPDENNKMNLSILDIKGEILVVSQFTLYGDCRRGRRPDFTSAASPELAKNLYNQFAQELNNSGLVVKSGKFGAEMLVDIHNEGPVTLILSTP